MGYTYFHVFAQLTQAHVSFVTRATKNLASRVVRVLQQTGTVHNAVVWIGSGADRQQVRMIEVFYHNSWYRYLSNELDPRTLPALYAVALYWQRWRIEDAFNAVKRLLGLAYVWTGSENGVAVQVWATWLLYAVLRDLTDAVAAQLNQPLAARSLEMVYRSLYHVTLAFQRDAATDPVAYLAANAARLGIRMRKRASAPSHFAQPRALIRTARS